MESSHHGTFFPKCFFYFSNSRFYISIRRTPETKVEKILAIWHSETRSEIVLPILLRLPKTVKFEKISFEQKRYFEQNRLFEQKTTKTSVTATTTATTTTNFKSKLCEAYFYNILHQSRRHIGTIYYVLHHQRQQHHQQQQQQQRRRHIATTYYVQQH
jgi:hypothetical protein